EGVEFLIGYPVNPIIEGAAEADIRTIMVRQERIGLHMCDAVGKLSSGEKIGVFVMQHGPGTENAFGGVAQSYGDSCPVVVLAAEYKKAPSLKSGPDPKSVSQIAEALVAAQRPVIVAGQGVHYGKAWPQLKALAELLEAPVMTTLPGKSAFPENHPLSLGSGGIGIGEHLWHMLQNCDFIFGIGCSFTRTSFGTAMPKGKKIAHATLDPYAINKDVPVDFAAVGNAGLTVDAQLEQVT